MTEKKRYMGKLVPKSLMERNEEGFVKCRWCEGSVLPPRRTMCSPECVHELMIRKSGRYIRDCVYKRDKGICSLCNKDTKKIAKNLLNYKSSSMMKEYDELLKEEKITKSRKFWKRRHGGGLWDADHIIPVKEGGGQCGLENIRTLCIKCHKTETKKLAQKSKDI